MKRKKIFKHFRYIMEYLGIMFAYALIKFLPHGALFFIADFLGFFLYLIPPFSKLITANLMVAFPEKDISEIKKIARRTASNIVLTTLEFLWFIGKEDKIEKLVHYRKEEADLTEKYMAQGTGAIWATPHIGNWELAGLKFKLVENIPFAVVVRTMNNPFLNKLVNSGRMSEGTRVITAKGAIKGMMRALKDGFFIATLIDQNTKGRDGGIFVNFFGLPVATSRAPALFARKMNVPVTVGGCIRKGRKYETFTRELPKPTSEYKSDEALIQAIMDETEIIIRQYPDQYLWLYERWRYIPVQLSDDKKKLYPYYSTEVTPRFYDNSAPKGQKFPPFNG
jgi:KDO2-lipid IV(A) lauroyltransferase